MITIDLDAAGELVFAGDIELLFRLFLEDLDPEQCDEILEIVGEVRAGRTEVFYLTGNISRVRVMANGAWFSFAAKLTNNPEILVPLDELEEGLQSARPVLVRREQFDQA